MARYRHWQNRSNPGGIVIATTTVLDFVPIFKSEERVAFMSDCIVRSCTRYGAALHAFVVMPEHIHLLVRLPYELDLSTFMNRLKSYSAKGLTQMFDWRTRAMFSQQLGLNRRTVWQRSFRGRQIGNGWKFGVAVRYIHRNPVKRGLCQRMEDYRWSTAMLHSKGLWDPEFGTDMAAWWRLRERNQGASTGGPAEA